jgi:hypothetical protein
MVENGTSPSEIHDGIETWATGVVRGGLQGAITGAKTGAIAGGILGGMATGKAALGRGKASDGPEQVPLSERFRLNHLTPGQRIGIGASLAPTRRGTFRSLASSDLGDGPSGSRKPAHPASWPEIQARMEALTHQYDGDRHGASRIFWDILSETGRLSAEAYLAAKEFVAQMRQTGRVTGASLAEAQLLLENAQQALRAYDARKEGLPLP